MPLPSLLQLLLLFAAGWVNRQQQEVIEYLRAENRVLREQLAGRRVRFTHAQRRRLARAGKALGARLREVAELVSPDTILRWYRELVARKYDGSRARRGTGRPRKPEETVELVVRLARENPRFGYTRIRDALAGLGVAVGRSTVAAILREQGLEPAPERGRKTSWKEFLAAHWSTPPLAVDPLAV